MSKNVVFPKHLSISQDMGATFSSPVMQVIQEDIMAVQINYTGSPTGTLSLQASVDYDPVTDSGNWVDMYLTVNGVGGTTLALPDTASPIFLDVYATAAPYLRVRYVRASGSGTCDIYYSARRLGG